MSSETKPFLYTSSNSSSLTLTSQQNPSPSSPLRIYVRSLLSDLRSNIVSYTIVFALTTLLWMIIVLTFIPDASSEYRTRLSHPDARNHNVTSGMKLLTCGESKTNEEAIEMGCKYDVLLNGWVPEQCYDEEFVCLWPSHFDLLPLALFSSVAQKLDTDFHEDNRVPRRLLSNSLSLSQPHSPFTQHLRNDISKTLLHIETRPCKPLRDDVEETVLGAV